MTEHDNDLPRRIENLGFRNEPPMSSAVEDDIARGQRRLRHRRARWGSGVLGITALATAGFLALPLGGPGANNGLPVASTGANPVPSTSPSQDRTEPTEDPTPTEDPGPSDRSTPTADPNPTDQAEQSDVPMPDDEFEYPKTRRLLTQQAIRHLDPEQQHLPRTSTGFTGSFGDGDSAEVGTKLSWTIPGEDGEGMILPVVTTPDREIEDIQAVDEIGCDPLSACKQLDAPNDRGKVWVSDDDQPVWGAVNQRPDGSIVALQVSDLFGNNSTTSVSAMEISRKDVVAFVTSPDLRVVQGDETASDSEDMPFGN